MSRNLQCAVTTSGDKRKLILPIKTNRDHVGMDFIRDPPPQLIEDCGLQYCRIVGHGQLSFIFGSIANAPLQ